MKHNNYPIKKSFRISHFQNIQLAKKLENCQLDESKYLREALDLALTGERKEHRTTTEIEVFKDLVREINYIGNNVNQIAHRNNSMLFSTEDKKELFLCMKQLRGMVAEIERGG